MDANASDGDDNLVALVKIQGFLQKMIGAHDRDAGYPALQIPRRELSNLEYVLPQDEHEGALRLRGDVVVKGDTCVARMVVVAAKALELRRKNEFRNQRDVYYQLKSSPEFALFPDIRLWYDAIADLASYFGRPRFGLGFLASSKGSFAGAVEVLIGGTWLRADKEMSINSDWLTDSPQIRNCGARYVVVVEDDGVFGALVQAGFHRNCVLLTGRGFPDIASRACLHRIATEFNTLPVYGVADCNPAGVSIVLAYKLGSANLGTESLLYAVPRLQWLCLRFSQATHFDINGLQDMTERDVSLGQGLLVHPFVQFRPDWSQEIKNSLRSRKKCELQAIVGVEGPPGPTDERRWATYADLIIWAISRGNGLR